jgi:hypothetical protein
LSEEIIWHVILEHHENLFLESVVDWLFDGVVR